MGSVRVSRSSIGANNTELITSIVLLEFVRGYGVRAVRGMAHDWHDRRRDCRSG
jgi:hypothetical protein